MRMAVAERSDRDARSEIEEAAAVVGNQIDALASHRPHVAPRVDGHERRDGHRKGLLIPKAKGSPDGHPAALLGLARVRRNTAPNGAPAKAGAQNQRRQRSEEHTSELQSLMRSSYAVFCLKKKTKKR